MLKLADRTTNKTPFAAMICVIKNIPETDVSKTFHLKPNASISNKWEKKTYI